MFKKQTKKQQQIFGKIDYKPFNQQLPVTTVQYRRWSQLFYPAFLKKKKSIQVPSALADQSRETGTKGDVTEQSSALDNKKTGLRR